MRLRVLALLLALAGCGTGLPVSAPVSHAFPEGAADTCGAAPFAHLLGRPATALERQLVMRPVRVLRGGDAVGDAMMPARVNFHVAIPANTPADVPPMIAERITAITCG